MIIHEVIGTCCGAELHSVLMLRLNSDVADQLRCLFHVKAHN